MFEYYSSMYIDIPLLIIDILISKNSYELVFQNKLVLTWLFFNLVKIKAQIKKIMIPLNTNTNFHILKNLFNRKNI